MRQRRSIRALPFRNADRLVELWETRMDRGIDQARFTEANYWDVRARNHSFEEAAALHYDETNERIEKKSSAFVEQWQGQRVGIAHAAPATGC
jgi:hypothetical protein